MIPVTAWQPGNMTPGAPFRVEIPELVLLEAGEEEMDVWRLSYKGVSAHALYLSESTFLH